MFRRAESGFTMAAAVFLLVILALLGTVIVTVSGLQHTSSAIDVQGAKAYQAARAGIEWGAYELLAPGGPQTCPGGNTNLSFGATTLSDFTTTVTCSPAPGSPYSDGGNTVNVYTLIATACNQPSAGACPNPAPGARYVERQLQATISK